MAGDGFSFLVRSWWLAPPASEPVFKPAVSGADLVKLAANVLHEVTRSCGFESPAWAVVEKAEFLG
jgi:hypothetical protein